MMTQDQKFLVRGGLFFEEKKVEPFPHLQWYPTQLDPAWELLINDLGRW